MPNGYAVYLESVSSDPARKGEVTQFLIVGPTVSPERNTVPYVMWSRRISPSKPQGFWGPDYTDPSKSLRINGDGQYDRTESLNTAAKVSAEMFEGVSGVLDSVVASGNQIYGTPLVIEVSDIDARDLAKFSRPKYLFDRVTAVRKGLNWDELPKGAPKGTVTK